MQRLVKGATKPKVAAPKAKYIEPLIQSTYDQGHGLEQAMDVLSRTLSRSPTWTTSYKTLIVVHIMIREGQQDAVLRFLSRHPRMLELDEDVARQAAGLGRYARYLGTRASQFKDTKIDYIRYKNKSKSRLHNLSVSKGLLRECESVVVQIESLLKCKLDEKVVENDVILMAFRLLVHDLLSLFQVLNEGVINLLEHFFELSRPDAEQALVVYRSFTVLTGSVISYLKVAKNLEYQTKLHVPNIKHAPTSLVSSLEIYLNDPDFEINRRQYLAEKQAHRTSRADLRGETKPTLVQQAKTAEQQGSTLSQVQMELERQRSVQLGQGALTGQFYPAQPQPQPQPQPQLDIFADTFSQGDAFGQQAQQIQMHQLQSQQQAQQLALNSQGLQQQTTGLQSQTTGFNFQQYSAPAQWPLQNTYTPSQNTGYGFQAQAQAQAQAPVPAPVPAQVPAQAPAPTGPNPFRASISTPVAATATGTQNVRHSFNPFLRDQPQQPVYSQNTGMAEMIQPNPGYQPMAATQTGRNPFHR